MGLLLPKNGFYSNIRFQSTLYIINIALLIKHARAYLSFHGSFWSGRGHRRRCWDRIFAYLLSAIRTDDTK